MSANIAAKKITPSSPQNHPIIGLCIKYLCSRDGFAEITKELNPKKAQINEHSKINIGDRVAANSFYVLVKGFKKKEIGFGGRFSGSHNCNCFTTHTEYTYAEIQVPYSCGLKIIAELPKNFISPIKQLTKKKDANI
ncbi:MAG: hypothetical protein ABIP51_03105 [Bacteroidia bacterium]